MVLQITEKKGAETATLPDLLMLLTCLITFGLNSTLTREFKLKLISGQEGLRLPRPPNRMFSSVQKLMLLFYSLPNFTRQFINTNYFNFIV